MKVKHIVFGSIVAFLVNFGVQAKDLGTVGETFTIAEQDLLEVIAAKLKAMELNGTIKQHQEFLKAKMQRSVLYPKPVLLDAATEQKVFYFDPTITVPEDLKDHKGKIFHHKGEKINPLDFHKFRGKWIFFDATSKKQREFVRLQFIENANRLILTNGSPIKLMQKWQIPLYFDQYGLFTTKFNIKHLPAVVEQEGKRLKITEITLKT